MKNLEESSHRTEGLNSPPPYTENAGANAISGRPTQNSSSLNAEQSHLQPTIPRQFPPTFTIYFGSFSSTYLIGEFKERPIYAMTTHTGLASKPPIVFHSGPDESFPPLATVEYHSFTRRFTVTLPSLPGSSSPSVNEEVDARSSSGMFPTYSFSIEVGHPSKKREVFEWRHSSGDAVDALGGQPNGWKLVRLETGPPPGAEHGKFVPGGFMTAEGNEIVCAWAMGSLGISASAKFAFYGTGASGLLGERWAILSVLSAMGLLIRQRRR
jgi:hypothetical protein